MTDTNIQGYLNKSLSKLIFSDSASLNLTANDMGEETAKLRYTSEATTRHNTAVGQAVSVNFFRSVEIDVSISKVSNSYAIYSDLIEKGNAFIPGTCRFTDDVGREYIVKDLSIEKGEVGASGDQASVTFTLKGTQDCNRGVFEV